jgi:hypothetical protein
MDEVIETIYCLKCKKITENINTETVQTNNGRWRIFTKRIKCKTSKRKFIKPPEDEVKYFKEKINLKYKLLIAQEFHKGTGQRFPKSKMTTNLLLI